MPVNAPPPALYDFAGFDGLPVARALFGAAIDRIAPFQSSDCRAAQQLPCSVLRLCENNFRVQLQPEQTEQFELMFNQVRSQHRVWLQRFDWLGSLILPDGLAMLPKLAVPKPPHRIAGLQLNCAAPGRIDGIALLVWRHQVLDRSIVELHLAKRDLETVKAKLLPGDF